MQRTCCFFNSAARRVSSFSLFSCFFFDFISSHFSSQRICNSPDRASEHGTAYEIKEQFGAISFASLSHIPIYTKVDYLQQKKVIHFINIPFSFFHKGIWFWLFPYNYQYLYNFQYGMSLHTSAHTLVFLYNVLYNTTSPVSLPSLP